MAGSVARRIIDHTEIPVVAVPDLDHVPFIKNVVYMTTFDPADAELISVIETILAPFRVSIFCLHLSERQQNTEAQEKMNLLRNSQKLKEIEGRLSFHIMEKDPENEILQKFMSVNQISLITFIPHKRNIFKNLFYQGITREDLFQTMIPIMAVRHIQ
ncbi:MAG: hypothetical protein HGA23_05530 [Bacteroidales bacterium]|nr:hypothetical protein [Bacteroidales bacterium]